MPSKLERLSQEAQQGEEVQRHEYVVQLRGGCLKEARRPRGSCQAGPRGCRGSAPRHPPLPRRPEQERPHPQSRQGPSHRALHSLFAACRRQ